MIQTISYQVFDNGTGGRIGDTIELSETFEDHKALENRRKQLKRLHKIDGTKHITIYFNYREPASVDKKI